MAVAQRARGCNGKLEVSAWRGVRNGLINLNLRMANDNILQTVLQKFLQLTPEWLTIRPLAAVTLGINRPLKGGAGALKATFILYVISYRFAV